MAISSVRDQKARSETRRSNGPSRAGASPATRPSARRERSERPAAKDQVTLSQPPEPAGRAAGTGDLDRGLRENYSQQPRRAHGGHDHGGHGGHGGHGNHDNHYWTGPMLFDAPPGWNQLRDKPPAGLSPEEEKLWWQRRDQSQNHVDWHGAWGVRGGQGGQGHTLRDKVEFFDFHRQFIEDDNKRRQELGLPPLGPLDPPPPKMLHPTTPDGKPVPDPNDPSKAWHIPRPDPLDEKYKGNFDKFFEDMQTYHNIYHVMSPDIASPVNNVLSDHFYQFHHWVEQQYQAWRGANPDWKPPG